MYFATTTPFPNTFFLLLVAILASITSVNAFPNTSSKLSAPLGPFCPGRPANPAQQTAIFAQFYNKFYIQKNATAALGDHMSVDYIQHNPNTLSGRQTAIDALAPVLSIFEFGTPANMGFVNNTGFVHYKLNVAGASPDAFFATADFFRFDGTCIVEHWDVSQQRPPNATNPLALF